jgi:hypothetical protein
MRLVPFNLLFLPGALTAKGYLRIAASGKILRSTRKYPLENPIRRSIWGQSLNSELYTEDRSLIQNSSFDPATLKLNFIATNPSNYPY